MRAALLSWYRAARRDLPWRRTSDPYAVWVSEVMLQQTRVETALPYYARFLRALPTVHALAEAPVDRVLELWSGLGYYRRARLLHRGAIDVVQKHGGRLPRDPKALLAISGIGPYTAGAIASIAFGIEAPIVDGNVARVLSRAAALRDAPSSARGKRKLWMLAETLVQGSAPGDLNQALMELGATVCTPTNPTCTSCPLEGQCEGRARGIEHTLPRTAQKKPPTVVALSALVIEAKSQIVLGKRKADSLYGGMWEPPMVGAGDRHLVRGVDWRSLSPRGHFVHVLTHRRLEIEVLYGRARTPPKLGAFGDYDRFEAFSREAALELAMSRLARRTLELT